MPQMSGYATRDQWGDNQAGAPAPHGLAGAPAAAPAQARATWLHLLPRPPSGMAACWGPAGYTSVLAAATAMMSCRCNTEHSLYWQASQGCLACAASARITLRIHLAGALCLTLSASVQQEPPEAAPAEQRPQQRSRVQREAAGTVEGKGSGQGAAQVDEFVGQTVSRYWPSVRTALGAAQLWGGTLTICCMTHAQPAAGCRQLTWTM